MTECQIRFIYLIEKVKVKIICFHKFVRRTFIFFEDQGEPIYFTPMTYSIHFDKIKLISNIKYVHHLIFYYNLSTFIF